MGGIAKELLPELRIPAQDFKEKSIKVLNDGLFDEVWVYDLSSLSVRVNHAQSPASRELNAVSVFIRKVEQDMQYFVNRRASNRFFPTMWIDPNSLNILVNAGENIRVFAASGFYDVIFQSEHDHAEHYSSAHHGSSSNPKRKSRLMTRWPMVTRPAMMAFFLSL